MREVSWGKALRKKCSEVRHGVATISFGCTNRRRWIGRLACERIPGGSLTRVWARVLMKASAVVITRSGNYLGGKSNRPPTRDVGGVRRRVVDH